MVRHKKIHARSYDRFIETQSNIWRQKLHRANQGSIFFGSNVTFSTPKMGLNNNDIPDHSL